MDNHYKRDNCRYCFSKDLESFLFLGNQPPSNSFIERKEIEKEKKYPLDLYKCNSCNLVQLLDVVSASKIFDDYLYLTSSSKALVNHFNNLTNFIEKNYEISKNDLVIDVGCNDGSLLKTYNHPCVKIGIEPSNVALIASKNRDIKVFKEFFNFDLSKKIVSSNGRAKIITATNVFAHVDDMHEFVKGVSNLLDDKNGVFIIEVSYLIDLIDGNYFDTIYHEHLCYLSISPLKPFLQNYELEIFDIEKLSFGASGPSVRIFVKKINNKRKINVNIKKFIAQEISWGIDNIRKYHEFSNKIKKEKNDTLILINKILSNDKIIGGFGAPAKGNTLLNYYELDSSHISFIAETNNLKIGKLTPGSHIPIISDEDFISSMPDYAFLLSWNYLEFFLSNSKYYKMGGKFIVPLPNNRII